MPLGDEEHSRPGEYPTVVAPFHPAGFGMEARREPVEAECKYTSPRHPQL